MSDITQIPAPRVPIIDVKTGLMSREWYRFFVNLFSLTGSGANTVSLEDVQVGPPPMDFGEVKSLFVAASPTTSVQYNNAGNFAGNANFTYDVGTNTVTFGNLTGSALAMTIQPKAPTVLEDADTLTVRARNANISRANANGGAVSIVGGNARGTGFAGDVNLNGGVGVAGGYGGNIALTAGDGSLFGGGFSATSGGTGSEAGATFTMDGGNPGVAGGSFSMGAGSSGVAAGGSFTMFLGGGTTNDGYMEWQDSFATPFMRFQTATPGGAKQMGFFGATPVVRAAAYTQTFSTASRTVSNPTFTNLVTTAATNISPFGFTTAAQANDIATKVNQLAADVAILRQLINSLIDDAQAYGLAQ